MPERAPTTRSTALWEVTVTDMEEAEGAPNTSIRAFRSEGQARAWARDESRRLGPWTRVQIRMVER